MKREAFTKGTLILNGITSSVSGDHFVTGAKDNTRFKRMLSRSADETTGARYERIGKPETFSPVKACPDKLRRVRHYIANNNRTFIFLTNNTGLKAEEIAMLCRKRREAELFSNGLNSICRSNPFWGTTLNAVKIQICCAVVAYCLVAIVGYKLKMDRSICELKIHKVKFYRSPVFLCPIKHL